MKLISICKLAKKSSLEMSTLPHKKRNKILNDLSKNLNSNKEHIFKSNSKDLSLNKGLPKELRDRLIINDQKLKGIIKSLKNVKNLNDPLDKNEEYLRNDGLKIVKKIIPIGVISAIYESRPNVTVDIASLCIKSGNVAILRGGKESINTNSALIKIIQDTLEQNDISKNCIQYIRDPNRKHIDELLSLDEYIDLVIPRGGKKLVENVSKNAKMRAIFGGIGVCHLYIDEKIDEKKILPLIQNSKLQAPSVCNALDTILIHEKQIKKILPKLVSGLIENNVEVRLHSKILNNAIKNNSSNLIKLAKKDDWGKEFLDLIISIKSVKSIEDAISHIDKYSFGHTDGIVSKIDKNINKFVQSVNSSAVTVNASTRFNDGGEIGLGSEIAISTTKVSPRGPLGLEEITTYKWIIEGKGHIRN
tara:strand:+ start:1898 stop:3151 length:1254 start_codon:yes stop_codon:yes gene_type:complete